MKSPRLLILTLGLVLSLTSTVSAGTFVMQNVWDVQEGALYGDAVGVSIGAEAVYEGPIDPNDDDWAIQTNINHLSITTYGTPYSGGGVPTANMKIQVDPKQNGAFKEIPNCKLDGNPHQYIGIGVVSIYRQWNPEIDDGSTGWQETTCTTSSGGTGGSGGNDPDDDPEDPPQTGTGGMCDHLEPCTPILVDLDRGAFRLTSADQGVPFDMNGDGEAEILSWTDRDSGDAWLALDRNGNGRIDDGLELFGNFTEQPASELPHGYNALAVFDSDGNGRISPADPVFPDLLLWSDRNHDGVSQAGELLTLNRARVEWIGLEAVESRARDLHGNEFRYRALVGRTTGATQSVDVFLHSLP